MAGILLKPLEVVVTKASEAMVEAITRQIKSGLYYNDNMGELKDKTKKLEAEIKSMENQMKEAERQGHKIEQTALLWLEDAKKAVAAAKKIVDRNHGKRSLLGRIKYGKKAEQKTTDIVAVHNDKQFDRISYQVGAQDLEPVKRKDALNLESRRQLLRKIIDESLKDPKVNLIGMYGIAGVGKSQLVKHLLSQVKQDGVFKVVTFAKVTEYPDLRSIQEDVAACLDLKFEVNSVTVRAARLCARLQQEEKVLVILDEIWKPVKLEDIGIPIGTDHQGCKVLMTSRIKNVLGTMAVQRIYRLESLGPEEAWQLFCKEVGAVDDSKLQIGLEIAKRCPGLPMLVVNIAQGLRMQGLEIWRDTLQELESRQFGDQVNSALELSYKFLENDEIKSLFLLCAQMGPDNIDMTYLLKYAIGLGLFPSRKTVGGARIRLRRLISDLKASCWLDGNEEDGVVHMTDVVYKFALSIGSNAQPFTIGNKLKEMPENGTLENCMGVSILGGIYTEKRLECPNLKLLFLLGGRGYRLDAGYSMFEGMQGLNVLHVEYFRYPPWPLSLQYLKDLRTLCFKHCLLEDISIIGELKTLQVLSIVDCAIDHLPGNVGDLTNLQILELKNCSNLKGIQPNMLSRLTELEELYIENSFMKWEDSERNDSEERNNASLSELKSLSKLVTLHIHITDAKILPEHLPAKQLKNFRILIGEDWDWSGEYTTSKMLKLKLTASILLDRVKNFLMSAEELYLDKLEGAARNVFEEVEFPQLKHLLVQNDPDIQRIISRRRSEMGNVIAFPSLESLSLNNLSNLEKICDAQFMVGPFSSLRRVKVENCDSLRNLFPFSVFASLQQLQEIDVSSCKVMEMIVAESGKNIVTTENSNDAVKDEAIQLKRVQTLTLEHLPQLASFCSRVKLPSTRPETKKTLAANADFEEMMSVGSIEVSCALFNGEIEFPNLVNLRLLSINVKKIWPNQHGEISFVCVQNLTSLIVEGCWNLSYILTSSMAKSLVHLKELNISDCSIMEEIIVTDGLEEETRKILLCKLESLKLKGLPKLRRFCLSNSMECPLLKVLWIENCPCLEALVHNSIGRDAYVRSGSRQVSNTSLFDEKVSFPNLEELYIMHMHKMGIIWKNEDQADSFSRLKVLKVEHAKELIRIFPSNMWSRLSNLETLVAKHCDLLKEVFDVGVLVQVKAALKVLQIENLPNLKYVWYNGQRDGILSFNKLSSVIAANCPNLRSLFPASVAIGLEQLEELDVKTCGVETLVSEGSATSPNFNFHQLIRLSLFRLKELRNFYPGAHTLNFPVLEKLDVFSCPKLELFSLENIHLQDTHMKSKQGTYPLFPFRQIVPNLKLMTLSHEETKRINQAKLPEDFFHKVELLCLQCFHEESSSYFPFDVLHLFFNIKRLIVRCSNIEELFPSGVVGSDKVLKILSQIRHLTLNALSIKRIWSQDSQNKQVLQDLESLEVSACDDLIDLSPSFESFRNLTVLYVRNCGQFVSLLKSTTARSLEHLTTMVVEGCNMLEEIVASEGEEGQNEIAFNKLESLTLHRLKSLICFSTSICNVKFPALTEVIVTQCPKMKVFSNSQGNLHTPKLKKLYVNNQRRWAGNLNSTIEQLYFEKVGLDGIQHLKLSEFPELREAWLGPTLPVNIFYILSSLVVDDCTFQSAAVPSKLLPSLNALEELQIRNCDQLEELFDFEWLQAERGARYLSNLKEFHLIDLPKLRHVWDELPEGFLDFRSLTLLKIHNCSILKNVFTPTTCLGLVQLKKLQVRSCQMLEAVIAAGTKEYGKRAQNIEFPQLESIIFEHLPNLTSFFSGTGDMQCPKLKDITIVGCPQLKVTKLCSFQSLTRLIIDGCGNLKYLFPSSTAESLVHLKRAEVSNCEMLEEVIAAKGREEETSNKLLCEIEFIKLENLPKLARFCTCELLECPFLKELQIQNCPHLETFVSGSAAAASREVELVIPALFNEKVAFPNVKKLKIVGMDNLKLIWGNGIYADSFAKLEALHVECCKELLKMFPYGIFFRLGNLKDLSIKNCDSLQEVFDIVELMQMIEKERVASQLREFTANSLPNLKSVWNEDPKEVVSFDELSKVKVGNCPNLQSLFPLSIGKSLKQLRYIDVNICAIASIVTKGEGATEEPPHFVFPRLKIMKLWFLKKLEYFFDGVHFLDCPVLQILTVNDCERLEVFATSKDPLTPMQKPLFSFSEMIPNLENLSLTSRDAEMIREGHFSSQQFERLTVVELNCFGSEFEAFPSDILKLFNKMEKLEVRSSTFKELFPHHGPDEAPPTLESLEVVDCDYLIALAPSSAAFPNLTTLGISYCNGLVTVMARSTARSLGHLQKLAIEVCYELLEIVSGEESEDSEDDVVFGRLEYLKLSGLPNLECFSSAECGFDFPSLTQVIVSDCPQFEFFSQGPSDAPKLKMVRDSQEDEEGLWSGTLDATIQQLFTNQMQCNTESESESENENHTGSEVESETEMETESGSEA